MFKKKSGKYFPLLPINSLESSKFQAHSKNEVPKAPRKIISRECRDVMIGFVLVAVWILFNGMDGLWMYYYVRAFIDPDVHDAVDKSHSVFEGFAVMMFMFGFVWGCVNGIVALLYYGEPSKGRFKCAQRLLKIILFPVFLFLVIMPFFGGWIVPPIVQKWAWNHDCDNFPMFVVIDAVSATAPNTATNLLHFYQQNAQNPMFTYETSNPAGNGDFWNFALREWDQAQGSIPSQYYPTLQQVTYDFINDSFSGNCTVSTPGNDGTVNVPCTNGTFFSNSFLSFNITSNVPLNGTANPTSLPSNTTQLRTQANRWTSVSNSAPSLTLVTVDPLTNKLQNDIVLRTAVTHGSDCAELKVCVGGVNGQMAGLVGAETLIPLGFIMLQQENYAIVCTAPDDDGGD